MLHEISVNALRWGSCTLFTQKQRQNLEAAFGFGTLFGENVGNAVFSRGLWTSRGR